MVQYGSEEYKAAMGKISELLAEAYDAISQAEAIADEAGVSFSFEVGGYGSGATYEGTEGQWYASSQNC